MLKLFKLLRNKDPNYQLLFDLENILNYYTDALETRIHQITKKSIYK